MMWHSTHVVVQPVPEQEVREVGRRGGQRLVQQQQDALLRLPDVARLLLAELFCF